MVDILTFDHCTPSGERKHSGEVLGFCSFSPGEEGRDESILNTPPHSYSLPGGEREQSGKVRISTPSPLGGAPEGIAKAGMRGPILNTPPHLSPVGSGCKAVKFRGFYPSTIKLPR